MKDLKCGLKTCKHNKGYCCCARQITVDEKTDCLTYAFDDDKRKTMFEVGTDFVPADYSVDTKVGCNAKCVFQKEGLCISNGITIMGQNGYEAVCLTYIKD